MGNVKLFAPRRGTILDGWYSLLAIDPGTHTGWAVFRMSSFSGCGTGSPPTEYINGPVVIELPQIYPSHPVPPNDLVTLAFLAGRYAGRAKDVSTVFPHEWKGNLPKEVCAARVRSQLSPRELKIVDECGVLKGQMHNVMDAIGIGLFFLDQHCDRRQSGAGD